SELLLIAVVALVVIGPKDLPRVMRTVGGWVGKGRAMTRHVRAGFDTMMREAELDEMQKQWAQSNAEIMRATPVADDWMAAPAAPAAPVAGAPAPDAAAFEATAPDAAAAPAPAPAAAVKPRTRKPRPAKAVAGAGEA
ncbi:MAG: Sec-independent protein translocase protein TatB, partial [Polymorphobacter sp.]